MTYRVPPAAQLRVLLAEHHGNVEAVAKVLQRDRKQVYRWMAAAGITAEALESLRPK